MPVHDWTKISIQEFRSFRLGWLAAMTSVLNQFVLPKSHYSMIERRTDRLRTHWPKIDSNDTAINHNPDRVGVYRSKDDRLTSYIEILDRTVVADVDSLERLLKQFEEMFQHGCHLVLIDLTGPVSWSPAGVHSKLWSRFKEPEYCPGVTEAEPFSVSAYRVFESEGGYQPMASSATFSVGRDMPVMPIFLDPESWFNIPNQETYDEAWRGVPARWKTVLEAPKTP